MMVKEKTMREVILKAAEKVFSKYGFYKAKMYKIAELAGISVGTMYRFFKSKEELYSEVLKSKLANLEAQVKNNIKRKEPEEALMAYISTVVDFFEREKDFLKIFIRDFGGFPVSELEEERFKLSQWYQNYIEELSKIVKTGIEKGIFKEYEPLEVILIISGAMKNLIYAKTKGMIKTSPDKIKGMLYQIFISGIKKNKH